MTEKIPLKQWAYRNLYLKSPYWGWVRLLVAEAAGYKCQVKGCPEHGRGLNAHHTTYKVLGISILFLEWMFPWFMVYLCPKHHADTHNHISLTLRDGSRLKPFGHKY